MSADFYSKGGADAQFASKDDLTNESIRALAAEGEKLDKSANLSDLPNPTAARAALGIIDSESVTDNHDGTLTINPAELVTYSKAGADAAIAASTATGIPLSQKGAANGVMPLDSSGKAARANLPNITSVYTVQVASQAAMLALTAPDPDTSLQAVRTDTPGAVYWLNPGLSPATLANWIPINDDISGAASAAQAAAQAFATSAVNGEATTARAAELALRNLTDSTFNANLAAAFVGLPGSGIADYAVASRLGSGTNGLAWTTKEEHVARALGWAIATDARYAGGADPTGAASSAAAAQALVDAVLGGNAAAGATNTRRPTQPVWWPGGTYKIDAEIDIFSQQGLIWRGAGEETIFKVYGTITTPFLIDGSYRAQFESFTITGDAAASVTYGIQLEWRTANAQRSTSGNTFRNINIRNLNYVYGFAFGKNSAGSQVDDNTCYSCFADGAWTAGNTTTYQAAFLSGNGTAGNVLNHTYIGCYGNANRWNFYNNNVVGFHVKGGGSGYAEADFNINGYGANDIDGVRCENSQRLMTSTYGSAFASISIRDVEWEGGSAAADGQVIQWHGAGSLILDNLKLNTVTNPCVYITNNSARIGTVHARGCASMATAATFVQAPVSANNPFVAILENYSQINASSQVTAVTPRLVYGVNSTPAAVTLGGMDIAGNESAVTFAATTAAATLNGTTAGTAVSTQPEVGSAAKKVLVYLNGYKNASVTAQTITFPVAFSFAPRIVADDSGGATVSATTLTLPASMATAKTGWIILEGF